MSRKKGKKTPRQSGAELQQSSLAALQPLLAPEEYRLLLEELARPLLPALRLNPLLLDDPGAALAGWAQRYGWETRPVPFCPNGYWLAAQEQPASATIEHRLGYFYLQDAASMLPVELFDLADLPPEPLALDMAASPGGKTTHLTARLGDRGLVFANDASRDRLTALKLVLQNWGSLSAAVTAFPGEKFGLWLPETFDAVLLDAPCSMQGLRATSAHPLRPITAREQSGLALRQFRLLESALRTARVGGQIVYATCTLTPEEDEAVIDRLLREYPHAAALVDVHPALPAHAPALAQVDDHSFHPDMPRAVRLLPHHYGTAGFFAARLTKTAPLGEAPERQPPRQAWERSGLERLARRGSADLNQRWEDRYGWSLAELLEEHHWSLWQRGRELFALPEGYPSQFGSLPFQALGLCLAEQHPEGWEPSHACAVRFGRLFRAGIHQLPEEHLAAWSRGEDAPLDTASASPATLLVVKHPDGYALGRGRTFPGKLKNMLPRRAVIW
ncbi:MAG: hypothetical protein HPY76_10840 [Anaerolineae bacterium]|nr:hypothetical protein [Anaerolineae bacterium]